MKCAVKVTQKVLANKQRQVNITGLPKEVQGGKGKLFSLAIEQIGEVVLGDTHGIWGSHQQTEEQKASFEKLFNALSKKPDTVIAVEVSKHEQISGAAAGGNASLDISSLLE